MSPPLRGLGHGIGLRGQHLDEFLSRRPKIDWLEAITELALPPAGFFLQALIELRRDYPIVLHGVCMALGSKEPVPADYLDRLAELIDTLQPPWISDHLCWGRNGPAYAHELMPLPFNEEAIAHVVEQIGRVQDRLRQRITVENVSALARVAHSDMPEWEFVREVANRSDCLLLLDVNNVYVNSRNHGFDPAEYIRRMPAERVAQIHLAGHHDAGRFLFDTHDRPVRAEVWDLYREAIVHLGPRSTLVEWDEELPPLERVLGESESARRIEQQALGQAQGRSVGPGSKPSSPTWLVEG
jgi:uncharacterized protein (UPF0276 family)